MCDYRKRLVSLMSYSFSTLEAALAITLVDPDRELTSSEVSASSSSSASEEPESALSVGDLGAEGSHLIKSGKAVYSAIPLNAKELISVHMSHHDLKRLELYARSVPVCITRVEELSHIIVSSPCLMTLSYHPFFPLLFLSLLSQEHGGPPHDRRHLAHASTTSFPR